MIFTADEVHDDIADRCVEFLERYYKDEIATALQNGDRSVTVEYGDLYQYDPELADDLVSHPETIIDHLDIALSEVEIPVPGEEQKLQEMQVRVSGVDAADVSVNTLRNEHRGKYLGLRGQVSRASQVQPRTIEAVFRCETCSDPSEYLLEPIPQYGEEIQLPRECPGCGKQGPFTLVEEESVMVDHQVIELASEPGDSMGMNTHTVPVHLYRDAAGGVLPGDRVRVNGKITTDMAYGNRNKKLKTSRPWRVEGRSVDPEEVAFTEVTPERVEEIQELSNADDLVDQFTDSIAPGIVSDDRGRMHKLAIALQFFSGVRRNGRRGDINIFLVGSKGTGKSQLLKRAAELAPKSVHVSGKGATAAGLTATAKQSEHGGWMLDAGALVLASGGMASIDEFDKMNDGARKSMHEAMEDQRVPINKAGINTVLPTETAVLAAANPMGGEFDRMQPLTTQVNLESPLLSRFDLIFGLIDTEEEDRDREIAAAQYGASEPVQPLDDDFITEYVAYARQNADPEIVEGSDVEDRLVEWYVEQRQEHADTEGLNIGPRFNDALRRLTEASARMHLRETATMEDAERAIQLKKMHIGDVLLNQDGDLDADFGTPKQANSIREAVEMTLKEITAGGEAVPVEAVLSRSEDISGVDLSRENALEQIENFKRSGEVYAPSNGGYKWVFE